MMERTGFTLIELLIVITIIGILASLLFPAFARAREKARQSSCSSNLKQMGAAWLMYLQDYEAFPPFSYKLVAGFDVRWHNLLEPYVKNKGIFRCPSVPNWDDGSIVGRNMSYGYNYQALGNSRSPAQGGNTPVHDALITAPAQTVAIADSEGTGGWYDPPAAYNALATDCNRLGNHGYSLDPPIAPARSTKNSATCPNPCPPTMGLAGSPATTGCGRISHRHNDGANILWADGHVKWMKRHLLEQDNSFWTGNGTPDWTH